jgi:imidazolonepropionase-like amidohydrolase
MPTLRRTLSRLVFALVLFSATSAAQSDMIAYTGFTLIDGTDRPPIPDATMLVLGGRITAIGPTATVTVPAGVDRMILRGKAVIPGLITTHAHVNDVARDLRTFAAHGVTTVVSLGDEPADALTARAPRTAATLTRARMMVAGGVLAPRTVEEARALVAQRAAQQVDFIKIRVDDNLGTTQKMAPEVYGAVIDEAHKRGMRVAVHLFYLADAKAVLAAGADFIAHSVRDLDVDEDFVRALKASGKCYSPTLMREVSTFIYTTVPSFFNDSLFRANADQSQVSALRDPASLRRFRDSQTAPRYKAGLDVANRNLKRLVDAGIPVSMGTDTGPAGRFQGYFELMELEMMVKAGLTPAQALASATGVAARCMRLTDVGTLETGKWADFVVLDANPVADIANVKRVNSVFVAGNLVR